jgi:addiction module HigA family antidote
MPAHRPYSSNAPQLPGHYVRELILKPKDMSVTEAAKVLGVGRPALSNFLNGNAAASPDMAARLERAFSIPAQKILELQAAYDAVKAKTKGAPAATKAYVPPFLAIKANEIERWVDSNISARTRLSVLLRTLVNSTGIGLSKVDFPGNDDAQRTGWDGTATATEGTPWIPHGASGWEFGTDQAPKSKADTDYTNRTKATDKTLRNETTFVFVTPRRWPGKKKWEQDRQAEGKWKDVRAYDASDLEQWLEQSVAAQTWFSDEVNRGSNGTSSLDKCWADWATAADPALVGSLFKTSVQSGIGIIGSRLSKSPEEPTIIAADSIEEALAFLAQLFSEASGELASYRDRVVVFRETGVLPKLAAGSHTFIAVAASRDVERELAPFTRSLHSIVVYPRNAANAEPHLVLEPLNYTAFQASLEEMKFHSDEIERLGRESGRSLTVLRRRLSKIPAIRTPNWANDAEKANRLIPFLLAGAWNSTNQSDQAILSLLAGEANYQILESDFQALTRLNDPPVWSVGSFRGVISKIDLLFSIGGSITELKTYFEIAHLVLSEEDPSLELPDDEQWKAGLFGKTREISGALRKGISETLVLLAVHGNTLFQARLHMNVEAAAAALIRKLLTPLTTRVLESHERDLPTYAEVAPDEFLSILEEDLRSDSPESFGLMRPVTSGTFGRCVRTGLLWALENLAWSPTTLPRVARILARLAEIKIEDNWVNKPIESLASIFRSWMPQTAASIAQRLTILQKIAEDFPDVAWQICVRQFGNSHRIGHHSHKPRWRNDAHGFGEPGRDQDSYLFEIKMVELALAWKSHNRETLGDLITRLHSLGNDYQATVWTLVRTWASTEATDNDRAWLREKIRITLMSRRGAARNKDPRSKDLVAAAAAAYSALEPTDLLNKHEWLFRQAHVEESADEIEDLDFNKREERIMQLRTDALTAIMAEHGIDGILRLAELGKSASQIGWLISRLLSSTELADFIRAALPGDTDSGTRKNLISGALHGVQDDVTRTTLLHALNQTLAHDVFAAILVLAPFRRSTWKLVDQLPAQSQAAYWAAVVPSWHSDDAELNEAVTRLLEVKRPRAAFVSAHFKLEKLKPALLFRLMKEIATGNEEPSGHYQLDSHYIAEAFKLLDASSEFSSEQLAGLEFPYIDALARNYGARESRGIPNLERYVNSHPEFFVEAVTWTYKRSDGGEDPPSMRLEDPEHIKNRASRGYALLDALQRIPGRDKLEVVESDRLLSWVKTVRHSCLELGRAATGDLCIGRLLSHAPEGNDGVWPSEPVRHVLEQVQSRDISRGMTLGRYNARGVHWRDKGGTQERVLAEQYRKWSAALLLSHPFVATTILKNLSETYDIEAKGHDTEAAVERRLPV